jgi:hypothetical protein
MMGPITLGVKRTGERGAGNPHATFDRAGNGNGLTAMTKRARSRKTADTAKSEPKEHRAVPDPTTDRGVQWLS